MLINVGRSGEEGMVTMLLISKVQGVTQVDTAPNREHASPVLVNCPARQLGLSPGKTPAFSSAMHFGEHRTKWGCLGVRRSFCLPSSAVASSRRERLWGNMPSQKY
jgi:hypothetical protein